MRVQKGKRVLIIFGILISVASFSFLMQKNKALLNNANAANLSNFDPGNIISDYVMSDYNSMTEQEIQEFLTSKNSCNNTDYELYQRISNLYSSVSWHWSDGHFVCISEEKFGDGTSLGEGETAAHIIWQAAQDYKINPQVLIVLLEKEQGLITDPYPHSGQYRSATGYGCPDTAACNEKYYGFKNQVRNAASLFRNVLNGGWTNYPLGNNYIQYSPNSSCGGSVVNIQNLATSALYRYTPYQPNEAALAAGYGTAYCGAYGNRNFYLYFSDWFGSPTIESAFIELQTPRYFEIIESSSRINPYTEEEYDVLEKGRILRFTSKILRHGEWCFRTEHNTEHNISACISIKNIGEVKLNIEDVPENEQLRIVLDNNVHKIFIRGTTEAEEVPQNMIRIFSKKVTFLGETYYVTEYDAVNRGAEYGINSKYLQDLPEYESTDLYVELQENTKRINPYTGEEYDELAKGRILHVTSMMQIGNTIYYRTEHNTSCNIDAVFSESNVKEIAYELLENPVTMITTQRVNRINPITKEYYDTLEKNRTLKFTSRIQISGKWYYRTEHNTKNNINATIQAEYLKEV